MYNALFNLNFDNEDVSIVKNAIEIKNKYEEGTHSVFEKQYIDAKKRLEKIILDKFESYKMDSELSKDIVKHLDVFKFCKDHVIEHDDVLKLLNISKILPLNEIPTQIVCYDFSETESYHVSFEGRVSNVYLSEYEEDDLIPKDLKEKSDARVKEMENSGKCGFIQIPVYVDSITVDDDCEWVILRERKNNTEGQEITNSLYIKEGIEESRIITLLINYYFR